MNSPHPFPMQPLTDDAPESLRQAWCSARHAWRMEQVASAEAKAVAAMRTPIIVYVGAALAHAEERTNLAFHRLFHEYRTALSTMDGVAGPTTQE